MGRSGLVGLGAWASESDESSEWQPRDRIRGMRVIGWRALRAWDVPPPVVRRCLAFLFAENHGHNSVRRFSPVSDRRSVGSIHDVCGAGDGLYRPTRHLASRDGLGCCFPFSFHFLHRGSSCPVFAVFRGRSLLVGGVRGLASAWRVCPGERCARRSMGRGDSSRG